MPSRCSPTPLVCLPFLMLLQHHRILSLCSFHSLDAFVRCILGASPCPPAFVWAAAILRFFSSFLSSERRHRSGAHWPTLVLQGRSLFFASFWLLFHPLELHLYSHCMLHHFTYPFRADSDLASPFWVSSIVSTRPGRLLLRSGLATTYRS